MRSVSYQNKVGNFSFIVENGICWGYGSTSLPTNLSGLYYLCSPFCTYFKSHRFQIVVGSLRVPRRLFMIRFFSSEPLSGELFCQCVWYSCLQGHIDMISYVSTWEKRNKIKCPYRVEKRLHSTLVFLRYPVQIMLYWQVNRGFLQYLQVNARQRHSQILT
jgi:hypothetical protein